MCVRSSFGFIFLREHAVRLPDALLNPCDNLSIFSQLSEATIFELGEKPVGFVLRDSASSYCIGDVGRDADTRVAVRNLRAVVWRTCVLFPLGGHGFV